MNLPLYSPRAPGGVPVARIGAVGTGRPFPGVAVELVPRSGFTALNALSSAPFDTRRVKPPVVRKIPRPRILRCGGRFPFELGGKPATRPAGIGIGLVGADVHHGIVRNQRALAAQAVLEPAAVLVAPVLAARFLAARFLATRFLATRFLATRFLATRFLATPIKRGFPAVGANRGPAVRQPECGGFVAAVFHELQELGVGHQPAGQGEGLQQHPVARQFVVEAERPPRAHRQDSARVVVELQRPRPARFAVEVLPIGGFQRVQPQVVLEIGEYQLLVLLLMVQAQFNALADLAVIAGHEARHRIASLHGPGSRRPRLPWAATGNRASAADRDCRCRCSRS